MDKRWPSNSSPWLSSSSATPTSSQAQSSSWHNGNNKRLGGGAGFSSNNNNNNNTYVAPLSHHTPTVHFQLQQQQQQQPSMGGPSSGALLNSMSRTPTTTAGVVPLSSGGGGITGNGVDWSQQQQQQQQGFREGQGGQQSMTTTATTTSSSPATGTAAQTRASMYPFANKHLQHHLLQQQQLPPEMSSSLYSPTKTGGKGARPLPQNPLESQQQQQQATRGSPESTKKRNELLDYIPTFHTSTADASSPSSSPLRRQQNFETPLFRSSNQQQQQQQQQNISLHQADPDSFFSGQRHLREENRLREFEERSAANAGDVVGGGLDNISTNFASTPYTADTYTNKNNNVSYHQGQQNNDGLKSNNDNGSHRRRYDPQQQQQQTIFEPPPADADPFYLDDIEYSDKSLNALATASMEVSRIHSTLLNSITRLNHATKNLRGDHQSLRKDHNNLEMVTEKVWKVASEVRVETDALSAAVQRHARASDEIYSFFSQETRRQNEVIQELQGRLGRHYGTFSQTSIRIQLEKVFGTTRMRFFRKWYRFWLMRRCSYRLMWKTSNGTRLSCFSQWRKYAHEKRRWRLKLRAMGYLGARNSKILALRHFQKWFSFLQVRRGQYMRLWALDGRCETHLRRLYFAKWLGFQKKARWRNRRERVMHVLSHSNHTVLQRLYYVRWCRILARKKLRVRRNRQVFILSSLCTGQDRRRYFYRWIRLHERGFRRRQALSLLQGKSQLQLARLYFRRWERIHWKKWVTAALEDRMALVDQRVEVGLRTAANTNETIGKLMEYCGQLEKRIVQLTRNKVSHHELRSVAFKETSGGLDDIEFLRSAQANGGNGIDSSLLSGAEGGQATPSWALESTPSALAAGGGGGGVRFTTENDGLAPFDLNVLKGKQQVAKSAILQQQQQQQQPSGGSAFRSSSASAVPLQGGQRNGGGVKQGGAAVGSTKHSAAEGKGNKQKLAPEDLVLLQNRGAFVGTK